MPFGPELTCIKRTNKENPFNPMTIPGNVTCVQLSVGKCKNFQKCMEPLYKECLKGKRCYGQCQWPNSNTMAYHFALKCGGGNLPPNTPPIQGTGCDAAGGAGASGYGPLWPTDLFPPLLQRVKCTTAILVNAIEPLF